MGWQLPATRATTLGTADVPTVSSSGRGDQLHQVAQSAELPVARAGRPSRAAAERRGCGIPGRGKRVKVLGRISDSYFLMRGFLHGWN